MTKLARALAMAIVGALTTAGLWAADADAAAKKPKLLSRTDFTVTCNYHGLWLPFEVDATFRYKGKTRWLLTNGMQVWDDPLEVEGPSEGAVASGGDSREIRMYHYCGDVKWVRVPAGWFED